MPAEDVSMRNAVLHQSIYQRHGHMVLPRNIRETLRPVFSCKNLISHRKNQPNKTATQRNYDETATLLYRPLAESFWRRRRVSLDGRSRRARSTPLSFIF
jgi:hypothetical protein